MTERNIAAEVLDGLREIREHRAGKRTLRTVRVNARPLPTLTPEAIRDIRDHLDVSSEASTQTHEMCRRGEACPRPRRRTRGVAFTGTGDHKGRPYETLLNCADGNCSRTPARLCLRPARGPP